MALFPLLLIGNLNSSSRCDVDTTTGRVVENWLTFRAEPLGRKDFSTAIEDANPAEKEIDINHRLDRPVPRGGPVSFNAVGEAVPRVIANVA
ncbi:hypothetical protein NDN08_008046 [Rhodosorus marinus]|uniref:Uncharacterized protein n=1 Tax=Rhodosorus marinus TaxID=101924 RepID=A0AAV8V3A8_9RHOD|nr:hypothetical protein NDN08_008046 [Rhodosorus marinus]